ncbi:MAG: hypothetical protein ABIR16_00870 [Dokdonella sp.]
MTELTVSLPQGMVNQQREARQTMLAGMTLTRFLFCVSLLATVPGCQAFQPKFVGSGGGSSSISMIAGDFDNHAQVAKSGAAHWRYSIRALPTADWYAWTVELDTRPPLKLELAMRIERDATGAFVLTPYRTTTAAATLDAKFDATLWNALPACALRGTGTTINLAADPAQCATLAPALGEIAALLPMQVVASSNGLLIRSYSDQALNATYQTDAHRVRWFGGWAAINGAGAKATADSKDWHMHRDLRASSEGGRVAINFRDGQPSGYSLLMETLVVQDGELPLLKLSVVDDAGQTIAYAWSDPNAERIGINLGWVQIGMQVATVTLAR